MADYADVLKVLGGPTVLRERREAYGAGLGDRIRDGLPYAAVESVVDKLDLNSEELNALLQVSSRTLARRKTERKLTPAEGDRLVRLATILAHAIDVFGSEEKAATWLRRPNRALGGVVPLTLLDTEIGARDVDDVLGAIEYGIVS